MAAIYMDYVEQSIDSPPCYTHQYTPNVSGETKLGVSRGAARYKKKTSWVTQG